MKFILLYVRLWWFYIFYSQHCFLFIYIISDIPIFLLRLFFDTTILVLGLNTVRASVYGELAPECVDAYFKYGRALLYKAQDEADILGDMPKKEEKSHANSDKNGSLKSVKSGESSSTSVVVDANKNGGSTQQDEVLNDGECHCLRFYVKYFHYCQLKVAMCAPLLPSTIFRYLMSQ